MPGESRVKLEPIDSEIETVTKMGRERPLSGSVSVFSKPRAFSFFKRLGGYIGY